MRVLVAPLATLNLTHARLVILSIAFACTRNFGFLSCDFADRLSSGD